MPSYYQGRVNAPDFPQGLEWLNTERPLSLKELRGKVVILDFWTYCCINCMHILPDLKKLEGKYRDELVVIGVHSAKFTAERETENIRQAVLRYGIEHAVVNDWAMDLWQQYAVRAWPTLILIDPDGKVVGSKSGEGVFEPFDRAVAQLIQEFEAAGKLDRTPLARRLERDRGPAPLFAFPGKVLADEATGRLYIADSGHNRLVVASLDDYAIEEVIGSGEAGLRDGDFAEAAFRHPQGLAADGTTLYVADTENHAIRRVDFAARTVTTLVGDGRQATRVEMIGGIGAGLSLNSPWDLVLHDGRLYVAMAGPHQLWMVNPQTGGAVPFAGSGREDLVDGPLLEAALAQPSGITTDGRKLYFADSEVSAVRAADLSPDGAVETLVGRGLFEYGDRDGKGDVPRLQHPLGIAHHAGFLYVADTYNNKVKIVSPKEKSSATFAGSGKAGRADGARATFDEPGGLSIAGGKLYVADTNNHAIRVADLRSRKVATVAFKNLEQLRPRRSREEPFYGDEVELAAQAVTPGAATLQVDLEVPPGYHLTAQAPAAVTLFSADEQVVRLAGAGRQRFDNPQFPLTMPLQTGTGATRLHIELTLYYCAAATESLCYFQEARLSLPVRVDETAAGDRLSVRYGLKIIAADA